MFKNIKFEKSKYPIFRVSFWILIISSIIMILNIFRLNLYNFDVKPFNYPLKPIALNLTLREPTSDVLFFCFNDFCKVPVNNAVLGANIGLSNVYSTKFDENDFEFFKSKVKNIYFAYPKHNENLISNIERIDLHIGEDVKYFDKAQISKLKTKEVDIIVDDEGKRDKFQVFVFENTNNYKGIFNHAINLFLSLFVNWQRFIVPYLWLFVAGLIYVFKKDELKLNFDFKINYTLCAILIFILGAVFRINEINSYPLWFDEIYTKITASKTLLETFKDAGNPPLFYIVENLFSKFSTNDLIFRLPSLLFGVLLVPFVYFCFKSIDKKIALLASFLASVNMIFIYLSQEARSYSMCAFLNLGVIYFLFKYLNKTNLKNLICFALFSIFSINSHYICVIFVLGNFLWGICDLIQARKQNDILKFIGANILVFLSFVPYLTLTFSNSLNEAFNSWIPALNKFVFLDIINEFFINKAIFIFLSALVLVMLIFSYLPKEYKKRCGILINSKKENLFLYLVYSITFILIVASLISIVIKPILYERALLSIYILVFLLEIVVISTIFDFVNVKNKILKFLKISYTILMILVFFLITNPSVLREKFRFDDLINFIVQDYKQYQKDYDIYAIFSENKNYLKHYPQLDEMNINWQFVKTNEGKFLSHITNKDFKKSNRKIVVYFNSLTTDFSMTFIKNPNMKIYQTNYTKNGKIIFE